MGELDRLANTEEDIIDECKQRFAFAQEAEQANRNDALNDLRFAAGEQWEPYLLDERFSDQRPALTINITDAMVRRVSNACRENRPRIKVHPVGDGADINTSKVFDGLIRHIENLSGADHAYDVAVEHAIRGGWGYLGLDHDYIDEKAFDQELLIASYVNPFMCYADPDSRAPDGSDYRWFIETERLKRTDYRDRWGKIDEGWNFLGRGDEVSGWSNRETIRIAKYWRVELVADKLLLLSHGGTALRSELGKKTIDMAGLQILRERDTQRCQVKCYLVSPTKVLEEQEWPGKYIPRVPVYGRRLDINGRIALKGMVRDLKDIGRMYNYAETAKTEVYALQPKAPWMLAEGQMEGHEAAWRDANRKPIVALAYKPVQQADGSMAPAPQRQVPPQPNAGFAEWADSIRSDFLAVAGMPNDPGQDARGEVVSGIAIRRRTGIADISHFDFYDNLTRALRQLGRIIVDVVPYFYDTQRMQRIIREDGTPEQVMINEKTIEGIKNDLTKGRYDVFVDTGPSYQTKREESAEAQLELLATPLGQMVAQAAGDQVVRAMDFPNSDAIADRIAALIPAAQAEKQLANMSQDQLKGMVSGLQAQLQAAQKQAMAFELELKTRHGVEQMKQQHEDQRHQLTEQTKRADTIIRSQTQMHDTHVKAVTAHDVAEINAGAQIMNTHVEAGHEKELVKETAKAAAAAEKRGSEKV